MTDKLRARPSGSGSRPSDPAPTGLVAPRFDPSRKCLSPGFAVFNGHINNADKRARAFMAKRCPVYLDTVEAIEREGEGIMHLFNVCGPTWGPKAGRRYIELVTGFVNEDAIATEAGTAETENTGSVHEGAGPKDIAQGIAP